MYIYIYIHTCNEWVNCLRYGREVRRCDETEHSVCMRVERKREEKGNTKAGITNIV